MDCFAYVFAVSGPVRREAPILRLYPSLVIALYEMDRPLSSFKKCAVAAADDDGDDEEKLGWGSRSSGPNPKPPTLNGLPKIRGFFVVGC